MKISWLRRQAETIHFFGWIFKGKLEETKSIFYYFAVIFWIRLLLLSWLLISFKCQLFVVCVTQIESVNYGLIIDWSGWCIPLRNICFLHYLGPAWPDLAKFRHFCTLTAYFLFGKMLSLLWQIWNIIGIIFIVADGKILKYNLTIWSHCLGHL